MIKSNELCRLPWVPPWGTPVNNDNEVREGENRPRARSAHLNPIPFHPEEPGRIQGNRVGRGEYNLSGWWERNTSFKGKGYKSMEERIMYISCQISESYSASLKTCRLDALYAKGGAFRECLTLSNLIFSHTCHRANPKVCTQCAALTGAPGWNSLPLAFSTPVIDNRNQTKQIPHPERTIAACNYMWTYTILNFTFYISWFSSKDLYTGYSIKKVQNILRNVEVEFTQTAKAVPLPVLWVLLC